MLGVVGNVGTPTAITAMPIASECRVPFFGAYTGAGVLRRTPPDRYEINVRASYAEETAAMVAALVVGAGLSPSEIAFFTQRDGYGDAGFDGGIQALKLHGLTDMSAISHGRYERNTLAVENGLAEILQRPVSPRAVIMVGAYAPCAEFIRMAREFGLDALFLNVSFAGSASLAEALGDCDANVIVTQVVPHPLAELPFLQQYREAMAQWDPQAEPGYGSLEGYRVGRVLLAGLQSLPGPVEREALVHALLGLGCFDLGLGVPLELGPDEHQASHSVWPSILRAGQVVPLDWSELPTLFAGRAGL